MQFHYTHNGTTHTIDLTRLDDNRFRAVIDERDYNFTAIQQIDGAWLLTLGNQRILGYVASDNEMRYVYVKGNTVTLSAVDKRRKPRATGASAGDLTAQMPGQVVDVLVQAGDTVSAGQTLVILEAMKMEIRVTAPMAGVVNRVFVDTADVVERGQRLIEIKNAGD